MSTSAQPEPTSTNSTSTHAANCLCCIGGPDLSFERAIVDILALEHLHFDYSSAAKFVRLCRAAPLLVLSKGKVKLAAKVRGKSLDALTEEQVQLVQNVVLEVYADTLGLERQQREAFKR